MPTERLYYNDSYLREFTAHVVDKSDDGLRVYLDRTAFYPTSGGQPFDKGELSGASVTDVVDEEDRIAHVVDRPISVGEVTAIIDWPRRFDHMQQHSGQHLLSAVIQKLFAVPTVSFHMGAETSTIEIAAATFSPKQIEQAEQLCAEIAADARPISVSYEDSGTDKDLGLRKASQRTGTLRLISMQGIDLSACGGTHLHRTSEIGPILIRKQEKLRGNTRLEFVCGGRAFHHAKTDFATLQDLSRLLSVPAAQIPSLVAANIDRLKSLDKSSQKLTMELAQLQGRELWAATPPNDAGLKVVTQNCIIDDALRARAQAFVAPGKAVFIGVSPDPAAILLAASADSGIHAGDRVKAAALSAGGKGGGNATLAQASLPPGADVAAFLRGLYS